MHPYAPALPAELFDYRPAIDAETVAEKDVNAGRGRFEAIVGGILADSADRGPDVKAAAVRTAAQIFCHAGWEPGTVARFAADHVEGEVIAEHWPHDPDCWCVICLFVTDPASLASDVDGDGPTDVLARVHHAGIHGAFAIEGECPRIPIAAGTVFLCGDDGAPPVVFSPRPYRVGITFADTSEEVVWEGTGYPTAVAVLIGVTRAARVLAQRIAW